MAGPPYHGRTHLPGGTDPIPGLTLGSGNPGFGAYDEIIRSTSGLLGYWPLDEASGDAIDHSGNGYDLPKAGTPVQGEPGPFANPADPTATDMDGDGYFELTGATALNIGPPLTFEVWANPSAYAAVTGDGIMMAYTPAGGTPYASMQIRTGGNILWDVPARQADSVVALNLDEWTHVVGTATTGGCDLYFNAELMDSTVGAVGSGSGTRFNIGAIYSVPFSTYLPFQGRLAQAAFYNVALSPAQIAEHYTAGVAAINEAAGKVLTADGTGGTSWEYPTIEVTY